MTHRYLPLALAAALLACTPSREAQAHVALDSRVLLPTLLPAAHPQTAQRQVQDALEAGLYWIDDEQLRDPGARTEAIEALDRGLAVLVTRVGGSTSHAMEAFGFDPGTMRALYRRGEGGRLDVAAVDDAMSPLSAAQFMIDWLQPKQAASGRVKRAALTQAPDTTGYSPGLRIVQDKAFEGGRRIAYDIAVHRDVTASHDEKVVTVKTQVFQHPEINGTLAYGTIHPNGQTYMLALPLSYRVHTSVTPAGDVPLDHPIFLEEAAPVGGKPKERRIDEKVSSKRTSGWSIDLDLAEIIKGMDSDPLGKLPVKFSGGEERSEERSVSMTVDDYEVKVFRRENGDTRAVQWSFDLSPDVAMNRKQFETGYSLTGYPLHTAEKFTPMMRSAVIETASVWRVPGAWEGHLDIATRADIVNRIFGTRPNRPSHVVDDMDDETSDIAFGLRLDLGSPRLTRQPTVRIQSLSGKGACLSQADAAQPLVSMQRCEKGDGGREQQWYLETDHTYRNRGSGQCLTVDELDGSLLAADCAGASLDQQWQWSADRLHSKLGGGSWRLHLRQGMPNAMFDPQRHQVMVSNHYHDLLRPWSSYPNRPTPGDVIPNPRGGSPRVPDSYLDYKAVGVEERWQLLPVIYGQ